MFLGFPIKIIIRSFFRIRSPSHLSFKKFLFSYLVAVTSVIADVPPTFHGWEFLPKLDQIDSEALKDLATLQRRPKWAIWRDHVTFDTEKMSGDIVRMKRQMEVDGFYKHELKYDITNKSGAKIEKPDGAVTVQVFIAPGPKLKLTEIHIQELGTSSNVHNFEELIPLKQGGDFSETDFQASREVILTTLLNQGHYWATVEPKTQIELERAQAKVRFIVNPGPITQFGTTTLKGNFSLDPELIQREFSHRTGEVFNLAKLSRTRENLVKTRWFKSVVLTPDPKAKPGAENVPLTLELVDAEPRTIGISLGMGSEEGPRTKLRWMHRNFLGKGWRNKVEVEASTLEVSFRSVLDIPYAFRDDANLRLEASYQLETEEDYDVLVGELGAYWSRPLGKSTIEMGPQLKHQEHDSDTSLLNSLGNPSESSLFMGPMFAISRDWHWKPLKLALGLQAKISSFFDLARKKSGFWKQEVTLKGKHPLPYAWIAHQKFKLGWLEHFPDNSVPVSERFYTGGSGKVRGYSRRIIGPRNASGDRLGGKSISEWTYELQHGLGVENLMGALFVDGGQLDTKASGLQFSDFRFGYGFGVGYALPMGMIKLDFGFPVNPEPWESSFQIHFDFGASL